VNTIEAGDGMGVTGLLGLAPDRGTGPALVTIAGCEVPLGMTAHHIDRPSHAWVSPQTVGDRPDLDSRDGNGRSTAV